MAGCEQTGQAAGRRVNIPHFWGWVAFAAITIAIALLTLTATYWPFTLPKSVIIALACVFGLWWLLGGLFFRFRFRRQITGPPRTGLRIGGWALDGWHARHCRHGSYWRAMRDWTRSPSDERRKGQR